MSPPIGQTSPDLLLRHLRYLESRDMSPVTVKARRLVVERFAIWLQRPAATATTSDLEAYLESRRTAAGRKSTALSPNTVRNEITHLRSFFIWLRRHQYRDDDPTSLVDAPRLVRPAIPAADDQAITAALQRASDEDRAILVLAAFAGLRACEVAALQWRDVDAAKATITVRNGKGRRSRTVAMSEPVAAALAALPRMNEVVVRRRDGAPGPNLPGQISKRATALLGGRAAGFTLHQLRHRFATAAYAGTHNLRAVQDALGHSSPNTTAIYAHTRHEDLYAAAAAAAALSLPEVLATPKGG